MLTVWGRLSSINVRKVVLTAQLLQVPFERLEAGGAFGVVGTPAFLARNPNGMVPLVQDEGFDLWESNVIVRYLCARHAPGTLYPEALHARFDAERWMDWQQTTFNRAGREAFIQLVRTPPDLRQPTAIALSVAMTTMLLGLLDAHLARQPYLAGSALTMADLPMACELHRWWGLAMPHADHPHVRRWYGAIAALPAAAGVLDLSLS